MAVKKATEIQHKRFNSSTFVNAAMTPDLIERHCILTEAAEAIIKKAFTNLNLSMRGYHKVLKVARTIADLSGDLYIDVQHVQEAIIYRSLDQTLERMKG